MSNSNENKDDLEARLSNMGSLHAMRMIVHSLLATHPQGNVIFKVIQGIANQQMQDPHMKPLPSKFWEGFGNDISTALDVIEKMNQSFDPDLN